MCSNNVPDLAVKTSNGCTCCKNDSLLLTKNLRLSQTLQSFPIDDIDHNHCATASTSLAEVLENSTADLSR